jgi:hypothetical protein
MDATQKKKSRWIKIIRPQGKELLISNYRLFYTWDYFLKWYLQAYIVNKKISRENQSEMTTPSNSSRRAWNSSNKAKRVSK